jgi:hypothetical protein
VDLRVRAILQHVVLLGIVGPFVSGSRYSVRLYYRDLEVSSSRRRSAGSGANVGFFKVL